MSSTTPTLRVASIGGGPGGLSSAIALSKLPNIKITIYEQARELREIGAGIQIGYNCWKVLELLGADQNVRGHVMQQTLHRNGINGKVLKETIPEAKNLKYRGQRVRRTKLQAALIKQVPEGVIKLRKRLASLTNIDGGGARLVFEDGEEVIADLVIGGDGIRSVVRQTVFPTHEIKYTGRTIWRTVIPKSLIASIPIPEMLGSTDWWHGPAGHFYNCLIDSPDDTPPEKQLFEIALHHVTPLSAIDLREKKFSWGIPATNERVERHFVEYDERVRKALSVVPEGNWKEFSSFSGPRLESVVGWGKVALIGDASHPLTGAFGSGAAFAMQDSWILAQAIAHTREQRNAIPAALKIFDEIRSPYYERMYEHLDRMGKLAQDAKVNNPQQSFEDSLIVKVKGFDSDSLSWIYQNDIQDVWDEYVKKHRKSCGGTV